MVAPLASLSLLTLPPMILPAPTAAEIAARLGPDETLETAISADLDGDGTDDLLLVARGPERRELRAYLARISLGKADRVAAGTLALNPSPLGKAGLGVTRGVIRLDDLAGGTSAVATVWRLRADPRMMKLRLIGLDAKYYSRTYSHDGVELSWNLLTGAYRQRSLALIRGAYRPGAWRLRRKAVAPLYGEQAPDPEDLLLVNGR